MPLRQIEGKYIMLICIKIKSKFFFHSQVVLITIAHFDNCIRYIKTGLSGHCAHQILICNIILLVMYCNMHNL